MTSQLMVFERLFDDGRVRNRWGVSVPQAGVLFALALSTDGRYFKSYVGAGEIPALITDKLRSRYAPVGLFETDGKQFGQRVGDIDPCWLHADVPEDPIANSPPNLFYAVDNLVVGWPKLAKAFIDPHASCEIGDDFVRFMGLTIQGDAQGKCQGVLRAGHGLLCTALLLAVGPMVGTCTVSDAQGNVVPAHILDYDAEYIRSLGCSSSEVDALCIELGLQPSLRKLLLEADGGIPAF